MSIDFNTHIECTSCNRGVDTTFQQLINNKKHTCQCGNEFNPNNVYDMYYSQEPIVKQSVDLLAKYAGLYKFDSSDSAKIEDFLGSSGFDSIKKELIHSVILYGNAYLLIERDDEQKIKSFKILHPSKIQIEPGDYISHSGLITGEREIKNYVYADDEPKNFSPNDIIHFKNREIQPYELYGDPLMRINLQTMLIWRLSKRAGDITASTYFQNEVRRGLRVPTVMVDGSIREQPSQVARALISLFMLEISSIHDGFSFGLRKLTSLIAKDLGLEPPNVEMVEPYEGKILAECGYDMSKDIEAAEKLMQSGILTPKEFEAFKKHLTGE